MPASHTADSKLLSYLLRHNPGEVGLTLQPGGWVAVDALLDGLARRGTPLTRERLADVVRDSPKQRFSLEDGRVRANQGHSVPVDLELSPATPPDTLWHGTAERFWPRIQSEGLRPQGRHHVHLSADRSTAAEVGRRFGKLVLLTVRAAALHAAGSSFYRSANGVWLVDAVPPEFLGAAD